MEGFYVSARNGSRHALLLGPYDAHQAALDNVERGKIEAERVDSRAVWYAYGTCKVTSPDLPPGMFNESIGMQEGAPVAQ